MSAAPTASRPDSPATLTAVAAFLAEHPHLPYPDGIDLRFCDRTNRHRVYIDLPQGADPLDSEHAVAAWADALGGAAPSPSEHTDADGKPWTHFSTEGERRDLSIRVVICHHHPDPAPAGTGAPS